MSVKVTSFSGTLWDYIDDEGIDKTKPANSPKGHSGQLDPSTVIYATYPDGSTNTNLIMVPCPEDDDASWWPVGGGADARLGQMLHLRLALDTMSRVDAIQTLKARIAATDGPERYCLTDADIQEVVDASSGEADNGGVNTGRNRNHSRTADRPRRHS